VPSRCLSTLYAQENHRPMKLWLKSLLRLCKAAKEAQKAQTIYERPLCFLCLFVAFEAKLSDEVQMENDEWKMMNGKCLR
jgi:hypothetical protein